MATTFEADWKKAKAEFTATTNAKKPTASFLGVFDKNAGISSSLKSIDAAKNVGDVYAGLKLFRTASDAYTKTLDKAIADPKITDPAAKTIYTNATTKLKKELLDIFTRAGHVGDNILGSKKKEAVDPAKLKEQADFDNLKIKIKSFHELRASYQMNRSQIMSAAAVFIEEFGNRVVALRATNPTGALADFLKDAAAKKLYDEAKSRYDTLHKQFAQHAESCDTAATILAGLDDHFEPALAAQLKPGLDEVIAGRIAAPPTFDSKIKTELAKKPFKRESDAQGEAMEEAAARLNPRHLAVKNKELTDLYNILFSHTTAATKAKQSGGADRAKASLAEAHKVLDKMEIIVKQIQSDYDSKKVSLSNSKDLKDILARLNAMNAIHKNALTAITNAQK